MIEPFKIEDHPIIFMKPRIAEPRSWVKHIPFAYLVVELARPRLLVELGTHSGNSYLAFCQAVERLGLETKCVAVDSWVGDDHAQSYGESVYESLHAYHQPRYAAFSRLMRNYFDEAAVEFAAGSVDLLHIDGLHTYEAVKHDFETWLPKLSDRAVVLFHDVAVRERGFGVWQFFEEICKRYDGISFEHGNGLGVLIVGKSPPEGLVAFLAGFKARQQTYRTFFEALGGELDAVANGGADLALVPVDCRLYYRAADEEYSEIRQACLSRDRTSDLSLLRFPLPRDARVDFIRIDPAESPGVFGLVGVAFGQADGTSLAQVEDISARIVAVGGERLPARGASRVRWVGIGRDPSVEIEVGDAFGPTADTTNSVEVTLAYEVVLEDAATIDIMDVMARSLAERNRPSSVASLETRLQDNSRSLAELERRLPLDLAHLGNLIATVVAASEATLVHASGMAPEMARISASTFETAEGIASLHERVGMETAGILSALATLQHAANGSAQYNLDSRALTESIDARTRATERYVEAVDGRIEVVSDRFVSLLQGLKEDLLQLREEQAPVQTWVKHRRWWRWW